MRKPFTTLVRLAGAGALLSLAAACDQKELCFNPLEHMQGHVLNVTASYENDWEYTYPGGPDWKSSWDAERLGMDYTDLLHPAPTGLRALVYNQGEPPYNIFNLPVEGGAINMSAGVHDILFYNNNTYYVEFSNLGTCAEATVTTRARSRSSYMGSPVFTSKGQDEITVAPPDALFGSYINDHDGTDKLNPTYASVTLRPLVFRYLVRWEFTKGRQYLALGRGALAGMAERVYLTDGHSGDERVTVLFDGELKPWGVQAVVNTFGAPGYPNEHYSESRGDLSYGLNLEVRLTNGKLVTFDHDITDQLKNQPRGGVIEIHGLEISDEQGSGGSAGAFNVEVEGWGKVTDVDIPF